MIARIRRGIGDAKIWVSIDESTDRQVGANVVVGKEIGEATFSWPWQEPAFYRLRTIVKTMRTNEQQDRTCRRCGVYEETVKHIVFECNDAYYTDEDFLSRLGLLEEMKDPSLVNDTKRILENWERETNDLQ